MPELEHWGRAFEMGAGAVGWVAAAAFAIVLALALSAGRTALFRGAGLVRGIGLVLAGTSLFWALMQAVTARDLSAGRQGLEARAAELTARAIAPGSPLACLDGVANPSIEAACEKALFASPESIAAALAYVDARLSLLAAGLELAARDRSYEVSIERSRRAIEADRFGIVAQVLATRGCTATECPAFKLVRDHSRIASNLNGRAFDANVVMHAGAWRGDGVEAAAAPSGLGPGSAATTASAPTGVPVASKYDFPSAASIPPVSIMNAEPPAPAPEPNPPSAPAAAASAQRAPSPPPARRPAAREPAREPAPAAAPVPVPQPRAGPLEIAPSR
jgi:hypothetical protein